jgi:ribosomal protein S18 acetylase RimI-like enzyme
MTVIRPIRETDIDAVASIAVRTWRAAYAGIMPDDYLAGLDPVRFAERRRALLSRPGQHTLVADQDDRVVGFATFGPYRDEDDLVDDVGELYAIYVEPGCWGTGAGRELLAGVMAGLRASGFPDMRLWVLEENHRARRFYERAGLKPDGGRQTYTPRGTATELPELRYAIDL